MAKKTVLEKLNALSNTQLIQLSHEIRKTEVADNALVREIIKDTDLDTQVPIIAFVGVAQILAHVLSDRFEKVHEGNKIAVFEAMTGWNHDEAKRTWSDDVYQQEMNKVENILKRLEENLSN